MEKSASYLQADVDAFNKKHPVNSTLTLEVSPGTQIRATVRSPAEIFKGQTVVCFFKEVTGPQPISKVR